MRKLTVIAATAVIVLAVLSRNAEAQSMSSRGGGPPADNFGRGPGPKADSVGPKADEKAYRDALKNVPPAKKVDPWGNMR